MDSRFFDEILVRNRIESLRSFRRSIDDWVTFAGSRVAEIASNPPADMTPLEWQWHAEHINDQYYLIDKTAGLLFASLAVGITATVENMMETLWQQQTGQKLNRATWGAKRQKLQDLLGSLVPIDSLPGFAAVTRTRLLGNCFKHNHGTTNEEWVQAFGGDTDSDIQYEAEDWDSAITEAQEFLLALIQKLPPAWAQQAGDVSH